MRAIETHHCRNFRGTTLTLLVLFLLATGSAVAYYLLSEEPEPIPRTEAQTTLLEEFAGQLGEWMAEWEVTDKKAHLAGFTRDHNAELAGVTRRVLLLGDRYSLVAAPRAILPWKTGHAQPAPPTFEEAVRQGRLHSADVVLWGTVHEFSHIGGIARLKITLGLYDAANWKLIGERTFNLSHSP